MRERERRDRFRELEDAYSGYVIYDRDGDKVGKVDELFVDDSGKEEYLGVRFGLFGNKITLVPMEMLEVDEEEDCAEARVDREIVKAGPEFQHGEEISPEFERRVRAHYGLESLTDGTYDESPSILPAEDGDEERVKIRRRTREGDEAGSESDS